MNDEELGERMGILQVRPMSPQWEFYYTHEDGVRTQIARVTERYIASPPFVVNLVKDGQDLPDGESFHEDRDTAWATMLAFVRKTWGIEG